MSGVLAIGSGELLFELLFAHASIIHHRSFGFDQSLDRGLVILEVKLEAEGAHAGAERLNLCLLS